MGADASHGAHVTRSRAAGCEIAVVGGGLVGMSLALALGRAGIAVSLIEARDTKVRGDSAYDARPIALSQCSRRILDALAVWEALRDSVTPITRIHVSDRGHFGFARLRAEDQGVDALGYVVSAAVLDRALQTALGSVARVRVLRPAVVQGVERDQRSTVRLLVAASGDGSGDGSGGEPDTGLNSRVDAKLMVLCDGGSSPLREQLGISAHARDYAQWAVTARVEARCAHRGVAYERFTAAGPLALLPMHGNHCGLVWSMDEARARQLVALDDQGFLGALGEQFGTRLGGFVSSGPRSAFALRLITASAVVGERLAIIGNAANHLHPVAGQGLNLGLRDAAALAEIVVAALRDGDDPGESAALTRYAAWRRADQLRVSRATDALVRLFSNSFAPLVAARGLGLLAFDLFPPAKRLFADHAMGLGGRQSRLARGLAL